MYWFRVSNPAEFLLWLAVTLVWTLGGWLVATHAFRLEARERLVVGFGLGMVGYLWFANLLGRWLPPDATFIGAALVVLLIGCVYAWRGGRPWLDWRDLHAWGWVACGLVLVWLFARLARGMAIFDDRKNISIVSTMATGDIPPHHYMNAAVYFAYHYGFQLLGSSLMRLGGLLPWSAYDLSKAIAGAYLFLLAGLLGRRYFDHRFAGLSLAGVLAFATGTRYLLLLLPANLLQNLDKVITVRSPDEMIGFSFSQAITQGIILKDGPPAPFLYGFMDGIGWPAAMAVNAGPNTMSLVILLLAWLLVSRLRAWSSIPVLVILFALWAMVWESSYALFLIGGLGLAFAWTVPRARSFLSQARLQAAAQANLPVGNVPPSLDESAGVPSSRRKFVEGSLAWLGLALLLSLPVVILQGGTLTEVVRKALVGGGVLSAGRKATTFAGFALRQMPAIYSGHLGALSIFSPPTLLVALGELGPVVLFTPWITAWAWRRFRQADQMPLVLVLSAWAGLLLPIFFSYEYDRDIVRFTKHGLLVWTMALMLMLWDRPGLLGKVMRPLAVGALILTVFGGLVVVGSELSAVGQTVLTEGGIDLLDAQMSARIWDQLPQGSQVFDSQTWRATMLSGRLTRVVEGNMSYDYNHSPEWEHLNTQPSVGDFLANGFRFVYVDNTWWSSLPDSSRKSLTQACVQVVAEIYGPRKVEFRRLLDLENCTP